MNLFDLPYTEVANYVISEGKTPISGFSLNKVFDIFLIGEKARFCLLFFSPVELPF